MYIFEGLGSNFLGTLGVLWLLFSRGGWAVLVFVVLYMLFKLYMGEIQHQYTHSQEWVFLNIKVPKENLLSTLAVESIFAQMHALHSSITFAGKYVEGKDQLWFSLEIVSLGGKISFVIRTPKKARDLVEAAFYAQYPTAEIAPISDYMENINYDPETSEFDIWGTEWKILEDEVIPIKTYKDFEHQAAEVKIIDPLNAQFEALAKMAPHEFYGIQIIIQPLADPEWKPRGENKVKELIGEKVEHDVKISDILLAPVNAFAEFSFKSLLAGGGHGHGEANEKNQRNDWMSLTDAQKQRVALIEQKIGKPGYKTKIRHLYVAPKEKFDGTKKSIIIGAYRPLGSAMTNQFKPDTKKTWTSPEYKISPTLEQPYLEHETKRRKKLMFKGYKDRDIHLGNPMFILNTEEIATLYHFPISETGVAAPVEKTESKKSAPPVNLPVLEL
jgi:hypothetical protein